MKNFVPPRELALAWRKKTAPGFFALFACAAGTILSLAPDAGAVAGAPDLPNLNYVTMSPLGVPSGQSAFNPMLINLTQVLNQPSLSSPPPQATSPVLAPAPAAGQAFPPGHRWASAPVIKSITPHNFAPTSGDLNHFVMQQGTIQYPTLSTPTQADGSPLWDGQGALPSAMQAPWHYSATNFDPSFRTPYWNEKSGFTNDSFELGLANTTWGQNVFNRGLAYAGKPDFSANLPVWGGDGSDVTRALFPNSASSRASAAL